MQAIDLKAQLSSLIQLQKVDSQIYGLNREKQAKPQQIRDLEAAFEAKKQELAGLEKGSLDLQKQKKETELELGTKEESAKKLQGQLYSLKTNKEYQTMLQQINDVKADASVIEDKILAFMDKIDSLKAEIEKEKARLKDEEKAFLEEKKKVDDRVKEIDSQFSQLQAERSRLTPGIDHKILAQYEKILAGRDGSAIVGVIDNSCLGCNMFVPAQVVNLIKMYDHIVTCEVCSRILYIPDETA